MTVDVAAWRAERGADLCECGHARSWHYGTGGAQSRCRWPGCGIAGHVGHPFALADASHRHVLPDWRGESR